MDERYRLIINIVTKKIGHILLCGVFCAGLLLIEKAFFTDFHVQTGPFIAETIIAIHEDPKSVTGKQLINYPVLLRSYTSLGSIIKELEQVQHFDFTKLVPNWKRLNDQEKIKWMQVHTKIYPNGNIYAIYFFLNKKELPDLVFLQQNANQLINILTRQNMAFILKARPNTTVTLLGTQLLFPKEVEVKKSDTLFKYGVIGFVLGTLLATFVVLVRGLRGQRHG